VWVGTLRRMDKLAQTLPFHFCSPSAGFSFYESEAAFKLCPHSPSQQKGLSSYFNAIDFESTPLIGLGPTIFQNEMGNSYG